MECGTFRLKEALRQRETSLCWVFIQLFTTALYNSSYQLAGLECCELNSRSWKGPDRGFGVWVGWGMHYTSVRDKFCLLKRKLIFLAGSDKITHDDFVKLGFLTWNLRVVIWHLTFFCTFFNKEEKESKYFLWEHYMKSVIWNKHKV